MIFFLSHTTDKEQSTISNGFRGVFQHLSLNFFEHNMYIIIISVFERFYLKWHSCHLTMSHFCKQGPQNDSGSRWYELLGDQRLAFLNGLSNRAF